MESLQLEEPVELFNARVLCPLCQSVLDDTLLNLNGSKKMFNQLREQWKNFQGNQ